MAFITGKTPQGNCGAVNYTGNGHYTCGPVPDHPGIDPRVADPINFYVRIEGKMGETIHLDVQFPKFDAVLCGPRKYNNSAFFTVAHQCVYYSFDERTWQHIPQVESDRENCMLHFSVTLDEPVCFVSVNFFYTIAMYKALRRDLAASPFVAEMVLGLSRDGQEIYLFKVTDSSVPLFEKQVVYLQGGQHCCEYGGPNLLDSMLRYLITEDARPLLQKYEFHITPVVSVADWAAGYKDELLADANAIWDKLCTPESQAIDAYLTALPKKPVFALDLHNARTNFLILSSQVPEEILQNLQRFDRIMTARCDYMQPGKSRYSASEKYANFKQYALERFGFGGTMELNRFGFYDREKQTTTPLTHETYRRLGRQLPHAIDAYLSGEEA